MSIIGKFLKIAGKDPNGNAKGVAVTENGEVKVQADELEGLLEEIRDKDFATDTKLELVRALLESINSKDYSTEVTLQAVLTELANLSDGTKAMKVQQTGSIVETENIITRGIYTSSLSTRVKNVPPGATGCTVSLIIHGVTGTFTAEQGVRGNLYVYTRDNASSNYSRVVSTKNKSTRGGQIFQFFPGANTVSSEGDYASYNIKLHEGLRVGFYCFITGTFEAGEGFDLEADITWMY